MKNCLFVLSIIGFLVTGCGVNDHENFNQFETTEAIVEIKEISKPQQNTEELEYLNERKKSKNQGDNTEKDNAVEKSSSAQEEHLPNNKADYVTENENNKIKKDDRSGFEEFISENQKEYKYYAYADMDSDGQSELLLSEFGTKKGGVTVSDRLDVYALKGKEVEFVGSIHSTFDYISIGLEDGLIRYPWSGSGWSQWMFCSINDKNQLVLTYLSINDEKYFFEEENEIHQISKDRYEKLYEEWSKNEYISFMKIESTSESIEDDNDIPDGIYECNHQKASKITLSSKSVTYTGKRISIGAAQKTGSTGKVTYTYYSDKNCTKKLSNAPVNAGTYYVKAMVAADSNYQSATSNAAKLTIKKASQSITGVKTKLTAKKNARKKQTFQLKGSAKGSISYKLISAKARITVNSKGKLTVPKKTKKGTYLIKVQISAKATANYRGKQAAKTIKVTVR